MIPGENRRDLIYTDHMSRYMFLNGIIRNKILLDAGCGAGYGAHFLTTHGAKSVTAMDISMEAVAYARRNYPADGLHYIRADIRAMPLSGSSFDCVAAFEILEHIAEHPEFLEEIKRVLKPGGYLVVSTPDIETYRSPNAFHRKELTTSQFIDLMKVYFRHVTLFFQSEQVASVIQKQDPSLARPEPENSIMPVEIPLPACRLFGKYRDSGRFNIAVCSDERVPDITNLILLNNTRDWIHLEGETKTARENLISARADHRIEKEALHARLTEMTQRLAKMTKRLVEIEASRSYRLALFFARVKRFLWR